MESKQTAMQQLMDWMNKESEVIPVWIGDVYDKAEELLQLEKEQIGYTEEQVYQFWKAGQKYWETSGKSITFEELIEQHQNKTYNIIK